ncbi:peptidoglycan-binding protein [Candidatus Kaiserbacteria bacterium]|nr:peptidoglycan-binding protein [Candidatus Kaiserbacteria bacterium]
MHKLLLSFSLAALLVPALSLAQENQPQPGVYCPHLTRDLKFRDTDATTGGQVTELQKFLADYYEDYPSWAITGNFRGTTLSFVQRFQREQNLPAYGYVGPLTRAAIAQVCGTTTYTPPPKIDSVVPNSGPAGTAYPIQALLHGSSFTSTGNTIHFGLATVSNLTSADGTTISFYVPKELNSRTEVPPMVFPFGEYDLYVTNANGTSNTVVFTLTGGPAPTNASCTWNNHTILHSQIITAYQASTVAYGNQCVSEQRTCNNGTLSGSYQYASCSAGTAASCSFNGQTVAHNASVTAYQSSSVPSGQQCVSQTRACSNGTLSGSYTNATCTVQPPPVAVGTCTYKGQTYAEGQSAQVHNTSQPGSFGSVICDNGAWVLPVSTTQPQFSGENICDTNIFDSDRTDLGCGAYEPKALLSVSPRHGRAALSVTVYSTGSAGVVCAAHTISWGDGTPTENSGTASCIDSFYHRNTHTYASPGSYTISYHYEQGPAAYANSVNVRVDGPTASTGNQSQLASALMAIESALKAILQLLGQ